MISVDNLSLYFGAQTVFDRISFMINKGDKIGQGFSKTCQFLIENPKILQEIQGAVEKA